MKTVTGELLREQLKREVAAAGGQTPWADRHGLSVTYVNDLVHARKEFSGTIARALGYERVIRYRKLNGTQKKRRFPMRP
jgi:hypothetical protein